MGLLRAWWGSSVQYHVVYLCLSTCLLLRSRISVRTVFRSIDLRLLVQNDADMRKRVLVLPDSFTPGSLARVALFALRVPLLDGDEQEVEGQGSSRLATAKVRSVQRS